MRPPGIESQVGKMTNDPNSHRSVRDRPPFSASWLTRLIDRLEINRTIIWAVLTRGWQILAGAVSFVLIASFLTPHEQGYYVTFWSFLALQSLVDLGFTGVYQDLDTVIMRRE